MVANTSDIVRLTSVITEPERKSCKQKKTRASPASRASHCYHAFSSSGLRFFAVYCTNSPPTVANISISKNGTVRLIAS